MHSEGPHSGWTLVVVCLDAAGNETEVIFDGLPEISEDRGLSFVEIGEDVGMAIFVVTSQKRPPVPETTIDGGVDASVHGHRMALLGDGDITELREDLV